MPTPYMNLTLPTPSVTPGPNWADAISGLNYIIGNVIDGHNHTTGYGAPLPLSSLILATWDFDNNAIVSLAYNNYNPVVIEPSLNNSIYFKAGEFYVRDGSGNFVQITSGGSVNIGTPGSITIDAGAVTSPIFYYTDDGSGIPAPVHYGTFQIWEDIVNQLKATIECAGIGIYEQTTGITEGVWIKSPVSLVSSYNLILPPALPAVTSLILLNAAGALSTSTSPVLTGLQLTTGAGLNKVAVSDAAGIVSWSSTLILSGLETTTLKLTTGAGANKVPISDAVGVLSYGTIGTNSITNSAVTTLKIANSAVTNSEIANNAVTTSKILDGNITKIKMAAVSSTSAGPVTGSVTSSSYVNILDTTGITTYGRPVLIIVQFSAGDESAFIGGSGVNPKFRFKRDGSTVISQWAGTNDIRYSQFCYMDMISAGLHSYQFDIKSDGLHSVYYTNATITAFEL